LREAAASLPDERDESEALPDDLEPLEEVEEAIKDGMQNADKSDFTQEEIDD
jgi:hypothetical protein